MRLAASLGVIFRSSAQRAKRLYESLKSHISLRCISEKLSPLIILFFTKLSNCVRRTSEVVTHSIRHLKTSSKDLLYFLATRSIYSIKHIFVILYKKSSQIVYELVLRPKGIAFVGGLQYLPIVELLSFKLTNRNKMRLFILPAFLNGIDSAAFLPLFFRNLSQRDFKKLSHILEYFKQNRENYREIDLLDFIRVECGKTFLLKKFFKPNVFTIFYGLSTPDETEWLRKKGYKLIYLQSKAIESATRWDSGFTYCSIDWDEVYYENITEETFMNIFRRYGIKA